MNNGIVEKKFFFIGGLFILSYAVIYYLYGEKLAVEGGLGWDGKVYAAYAKDFISEITSTNDTYHKTRIFPSFLIWFFCKILHVELKSPESVFTAFYILNNICFLLIAYIWYKISVLKSLRNETYILGFICFFINFVFLKYYQYAPVVVDIFAVMLGISALYFHLKQSTLGLILLLIPTMFAWPIGVVFIFILLVFHQPIISAQLNKKQQYFMLFVAATYVISLIVLSNLEHVRQLWVLQATNISVTFSWLSAILAGIYIFYIGQGVSVEIFATFRKINVRNLFIFIMLFMLMLMLYKYVSSLSSYRGQESTLLASSTSPKRIIKFLFFYIPTAPLIKPGIFFIMQVLNWGPAAIMWVIFSKKMFQKAYQESNGLTLLLLISFYFSLNPQFRFNSFLIPLNVFLLASVIQQLDIDYKFCFLLSIIAWLSSKVYYPINTRDIPYMPSLNDLYTTNLQRFFMNTGYWVSWQGYFVGLGLTIIISILLYALLCKFEYIKKFKHFGILPKADVGLR